MPRKAPTKRVDSDHAAKYLSKARALLADARNQAVFTPREARDWLRRLERVAAWAERRYTALA